MATATVTFDASDYGGVDFDIRRTKVYATNNTEDGVIVDVLGNHEYFGSAQGTISTDGTGSITVPVPGAGFIPETWQTTIHFDYPDRNADRGRDGVSFGPFTITGTTRTVSNKALTSNVATLTTSTAHGLAVGNSVTVSGVDSTFNGTYTIASVPTSTTLTYAKTASNVTSVAATGTLTSPNVRLGDLVEEMPTPPAYFAPALQRIDGVDDHGSVSGAVELDSDISTHWLDASGATVLTLADGPAGEATRYVSVLVISGADDVTIDGLEDVTLTDGAFATFAWVRGAWMLAAAGGDTGPADVTPPSNLTGLVAGTPTSTTIPFSWTASTDAESTVRYAWRIKVTGGTYGAWTTGITGTSATATGLTYSTDYTIEVYPYSSGGSATGMTVTATTGAYVPASGDVLTSDSMAGAFDDGVSGRTTDLYAGGIARTWAETGTAGGWDVNGTGQLEGPTTTGGAALNYGYGSAAKIEFDITAAGPNPFLFGIGASLASFGALFTFNTNTINQENVTPDSGYSSSIIGLGGQAWAGSSVAGHWIFQIVGTVITVTRPDGFVWHGTTSSAFTGTYVRFASSGYTSGGWKFEDIKVTSP